MLVIAALFPILSALLLMCRFKLSPGKAMPIAWLLAVILANLIWHQSISVTAAATIQGIFKSLDIIFIIFGALLLLNAMHVNEYGNTLIGVNLLHHFGADPALIAHNERILPAMKLYDSIAG